MLALTKYRAHPSNPSAPAPRTLANQARLPRLPVPPLEQTLAKYVRSLEPLVRQLEEQGKLPPGSSAEQELQKRKEWAEELLKEGGLGERLQLRLKGEPFCLSLPFS